MADRHHLYSKNEGPNKLLLAVVVLSAIIHFYIFLQISGLYRSKLFSTIELTLIEITKPVTRNIPRPKIRKTHVDRPDDVKRLLVPENLPNIKPLKLEPFNNNLSDGIVENIGIPDVPNAPGYSISEYLAGMGNSVEYETIDAYQDMVEMKIKSAQKYPEEARSKNIEGAVLVSFILTLQGNVKELKILERSRSLLLDSAALKAVKDAGPFPKPPGKFFKSDVTFVVKLVFELT